MIFLRPTIVRDDATMTALTGQKYNLIRARQLDRQAQGISLMPGISTPVLPEQPSAQEFLKELRKQMDEKTVQDNSYAETAQARAAR